MEAVRWAMVGPGRLALTHRPRLKDIARLQQQGCHRVVTIQGNHEAPGQIERAVKQAGMAWTWIPVGSAKFPQDEEDALMRSALKDLAAYVRAGESVLIHCSAGIHRTGMFAFGLLRWLGLSEAESLEKISAMRPQTREGMHEHHIAWGNQVVAEAGNS